MAVIADLELTSDRISVSRTANGRCVLAYSAAGRPIHLKMSQLLQGTMFVWWFNPRTGHWFAGGVEKVNSRPFASNILSGPGAADHQFDPSGDAGPGLDWVLILCAEEGL